MKCEYCNNDHDGSYGSGRFCSKKCAKGFSTKEKRNGINKKVSIKLKYKQIPWNAGKKIKPREKVICKTCGKSFEKIIGKNKKYCSTLCGIHAKRPGNGGLRDGGGHAKVFLYKSEIAGQMKLNKEEIEIAKIFDKLKIQWIRNKIGFNYIALNGEQRKYYPDFYLPQYNLYIEYKGWITYEMHYKMEQAKKLNNINLLIIYSNDKRYKNLGLNLRQLKNEPTLLLKNL